MHRDVEVTCRDVREIQRAAAVLACPQCAAEHENEVDADLADAVAVIRVILTAVAARVVTGTSKESAGDE